MSLSVQYVLKGIEEKRISMDNTNTSGEQNDRIQTYFLLATERSSFAMYGVRYIWQSVQKKPFQTEELRGQTFRNFEHVSVSCIKWCVYKKYTFGLPFGFWKQFLSATTCKMIHFWEKDREERINFEGSLKVRTVHCRPTTFWFYRRLLWDVYKILI